MEEMQVSHEPELVAATVSVAVWRPFILIAGVLQLLVAFANGVAVRMFRYGEQLRTVPSMIREIFVVQNIFLVLVLFGMSLLCFVFPEELAGQSLLGSALSLLFGIFWLLRLGFQLFYYDRKKRRQYRLFDVLFLLTFTFLSAVFLFAGSGGILEVG